jgi:hypothetical protein
MLSVGRIDSEPATPTLRESLITVIEPRESEIRKLAFELFELRGRKHGWDLADWICARRAARFYKNYERVFFNLLFAPKRTNVAVSVPQTCRFCKRTRPEVTFSSEAHAVPMFLGNRAIFSKSECDHCNNDFSKYLEDHFARFLHGTRTSGKMRGRKRIPTYTTNRNLSRFFVNGDRIEIHQYPYDSIAMLDPETNTARIELQSQPYTPLAVYKCLTKIALSIMPDDELPHFLDSISWVVAQDHNVRAHDFRNALGYLAFTPGPLPEHYGWVELFRRRQSSLRVPYMVLALVSMNLTFQIYVPLCSQDLHQAGQQMTMPAFPAGINCGYEFGETEFVNMPISSPDPATHTNTVIWTPVPTFG